MKNLVFILAVLSIIGFTSCNENRSEENDQNEKSKNLLSSDNPQTSDIYGDNMQFGDIKTNYHDLPQNRQGEFAKALALDENQEWTKKTINILKEYTDTYILAKENPVSRGITSNYFWYVYNALPDFVNEDERHKGYYAGENKQSFEEQLKAYGIYRIDRSSENLKTLFEFGKPIIEKIVSPEKYSTLGIEQKVSSLIQIYDMLSETEDFKQRLNEAYNHADTATGTWVNYGEKPVFESYSAAYGLDAYTLSEIICQYFEYDRYHPYYGHPDLSFWMRRVHEENTETVYELLQSIQSIYK